MTRPRPRRPSERRTRELRAHLLGDDPANYPETILSLIAEPICPECAAGKHANCVGQALDEQHDEIVSCYCPTCGAAAPCAHCHDEPPRGHTCPRCGRVGDDA